MPPQRPKRGPAPNKGLAPGESLKRYLVPTRNLQPALWSWVGSEVSRAADISTEHCLTACGFSTNYPFCVNKYGVSQLRQTPAMDKESGTGEDNIIVISDDEGDKCTKKSCKDNPNCLNYLGQDKWEDEDNALSMFLKVATIGCNPTQDSREPDLPVGLMNLGATCYANASLQVWFRNLAFRRAVYQCALQQTKDSPLFQLQVTFAALQESSRKVFNPAPLVESLQLRAAEQQDAQEFSKLFMSHLDTEFRKQSMSELHSLVSNQFQGTQLYGTTCSTCRYRSEKSADFLEIETRFDSNSKLENCLSTMLQEEQLTGDNQYRCPQCNELRDAIRYTRLSKLPPTLHFSLLRFVYDFSTMERRKSKYTISFPTTLDMSQFLKDDGESSHREREPNIYDLVGILLHKGASAYHGHYEAQVYDTERRSWFQFNDEVVTNLKALGDKKNPKDSTIVIDEDEPPGTGQTKRPAKRKHRVVSEDEIEASQPSITQSRTISSRDAYMLIYTRRSDQNQITDTPVPPEQAMEIIHTLNKEYKEECNSFIQKEESIGEQFVSVRRQVTDVYRTWNPTSTGDDCVVLARKWLQDWLAQDCMRLAKLVSGGTQSETEGKLVEEVNKEGPLATGDDGILCKHQMLDPAKAKSMKRIRRVAYQKMVELTGCRNEPLLSPRDVCRECVLAEFEERLYSVEHPKLVKEFDQMSEVEEDTPGLWISRKWLKDWRLLKPKMHKPSEDDPAPDSPDYRSDVWCEHGTLALNNLNRRKIPEQGARLLKRLFPSWELIHGNVEPCAICDAILHISKEDKRELRQRAEEEKALLKTMFEETPFTDEDDSFTIIPTDFFKAWFLWVNSPADQSRPNKLNNSSSLCEHGLLALDPNHPSDMHMTVTIIRRCDWEVLQKMYDSGPCIGLRKAAQNSDDRLYEPDIPVCEGCRLKRKTEWVSTDILVQLLRRKATETFPNRRPIATYSNKNGTRQSKRLRQARDNEKRRFAVTKKTTVKDVKVKIQESLKIPTICQRLFFRGQELQDNDATLEDLRMFANETLDLQEEDEIHEVDSDFEERPVKKQRRETERGFGGTVLSDGVGEHEPGREQSFDSREDTPHGLSPMPTEKICVVCTLINAYDAVACNVCDTPFV